MIAYLVQIYISYSKNRYSRITKYIIKMYIKSQTVANKMKTNLRQFILE